MPAPPLAEPELPELPLEPEPLSGPPDEGGPEEGGDIGLSCSVVVPDAVDTWADVASAVAGPPRDEPTVGHRGHHVLAVLLDQAHTGDARGSPTLDQRVRTVSRGR